MRKVVGSCCSRIIACGVSRGSVGGSRQCVVDSMEVFWLLFSFGALLITISEIQIYIRADLYCFPCGQHWSNLDEKNLATLNFNVEGT